MKCKVQTPRWEKVQGEDTTFSSLTPSKLSKIQWAWVTSEYNFESSILLNIEDSGASATTAEVDEFESMQ